MPRPLPGAAFSFEPAIVLLDGGRRAIDRALHRRGRDGRVTTPAQVGLAGHQRTAVGTQACTVSVKHRCSHLSSFRLTRDARAKGRCPCVSTA